MKLVRPKRPIGYSRKNWNDKTDYDNAMTAYWHALAIYKMMGGKD